MGCASLGSTWGEESFQSTGDHEVGDSCRVNAHGEESSRARVSHFTMVHGDPYLCGILGAVRPGVGRHLHIDVTGHIYIEHYNIY